MSIGKNGFSILEVLMGMTIFMIGMIGISMLLVSSIKGEAYSNRLGEATMQARSVFEQLLSAPYDNSTLNDGTRMLDDINNADDDAEYADPDKFDGTDTTGLGIDKDTVDPADPTQVEHDLGLMGSMGATTARFRVFYNVCEDTCLMPETKVVRVFVRWAEKGEDRTIEFFGVVPRT